MTPQETLLDELRKPDARPLFVTGAGISVASGIPPFRGSDPNAVWAKDVLQMGTIEFFHKDPVKQWQWYLKRFDACQDAQPNAGHLALAELEKLFVDMLLVTQNIDGLHVRAGSTKLVEVHGSARKVRCGRRSCKYGAPQGTLPWDNATWDAFRTEPNLENIPRCPICGKILRAHVL